MRKFMVAAPGAIWLAIIGLTNGAAWLIQFYGDLDWVGPLVGFVTIVGLPLLKAWAGEVVEPVVRGEVGVTRSHFSRWLW